MKTKYTCSYSARDYRAMMENHYRTKYFNLFMSSYEWKGLTREEREFVMRQLWKKGVISAFRINDYILGFAPFAPQNWNMYGSPTEVNIINVRGVPYLPSKPLKTGEMRINVARGVEEPEVVLGWAQHSLTPIAEAIEPLIQQIVDVEMTIRTNRFGQKLPILYGITPENRNKMTALVNSILSDEPNLGIEISEIDSITTLQSNPPYIIDKLTNCLDALENKVLTLLGIDNDGRQKMERENVDETNSNNEMINDYQESVLSNLQEWAGLVNIAFGSEISVEAKFKPVDSFHGKETNNEEGKETQE